MSGISNHRTSSVDLDLDVGSLTNNHRPVMRACILGPKARRPISYPNLRFSTRARIERSEIRACCRWRCRIWIRLSRGRRRGLSGRRTVLNTRVREGTFASSPGRYRLHQIPFRLPGVALWFAVNRAVVVFLGYVCRHIAISRRVLVACGAHALIEWAQKRAQTRKRRRHDCVAHLPLCHHDVFGSGTGVEEVYVEIV
jgi:hypothetical protein